MFTNLANELGHHLIVVNRRETPRPPAGGTARNVQAGTMEQGPMLSRALLLMDGSKNWEFIVVFKLMVSRVSWDFQFSLIFCNHVDIIGYDQKIKKHKHQIRVLVGIQP